jgi:hypothetical protein
MRTTDELIRIAANGGGMDFKAAALPTDDLVKIASSASAKSTIIMRGLGGRSTDDLARISASSRGSVILGLD